MNRLKILESALDVGLGRKYGHTGDDTQDCVRFAEAILVSAFPDLRWDGTHSAMMIQDVAEPFSNITALARLGFPQVQAPEPGSFHLVQGWRSLSPPGGHCFLWWEPEGPVVSEPMILEATSATTDWYRPAVWADVVARYPAGLRLVECDP